MGGGGLFKIKVSQVVQGGDELRNFNEGSKWLHKGRDRRTIFRRSLVGEETEYVAFLTTPIHAFICRVSIEVQIRKPCLSRKFSFKSSRRFCFLFYTSFSLFFDLGGGRPSQGRNFSLVAIVGEDCHNWQHKESCTIL